MDGDRTIAHTGGVDLAVPFGPRFGAISKTVATHPDISAVGERVEAQLSELHSVGFEL